MKVSTHTLNNFISAIQKVGETDVNKILEKLNDKDMLIIDEVIEMCCNRFSVNKSFLFIKNNRQKRDVLISIIYILRKNKIKPKSIFRYFDKEKVKVKESLRVNELYLAVYKLNPEIPSEAKLKSIILELEEKSQSIYRKYNF